MTSTNEAVTIPANLTMHHPDCHCAPCDARREGTMPAPFEALRIVEHDGPDDTMHVQVALTAHAWRECVSAIGRAIVSGRLPTHRMLAAGAPGIDGIHAAQAIARAVLAPSWTITGEAAEALALDLSEAAEEPADCARCDRWVDIDGAYCSGCEQVRNAVEAALGEES